MSYVEIRKLAENLENPAMSSRVRRHELGGIRYAFVEEKASMLPTNLVEAHWTIPALKSPDNSEYDRRRAAHAEDDLFEFER